MSDILPPLVLGSSSRYRRELLERLRLPFTTASPDIDESCLGDETPRAQAIRLARLKAQAIALRHPDSCIIGSDQVAWSGARRYGKPGTRDAAIAQLLQPARMLRLAEQEAYRPGEAYRIADLFADLRAGIWGELAGSGPIDRWRRTLQREHLSRLAALMTNPATPPATPAAAQAMTPPLRSSAWAMSVC